MHGLLQNTPIGLRCSWPADHLQFPAPKKKLGEILNIKILKTIAYETWQYLPGCNFWIIIIRTVEMKILPGDIVEKEVGPSASLDPKKT